MHFYLLFRNNYVLKLTPVILRGFETLVGTDGALNTLKSADAQDSLLNVTFNAL